MGNGSSCADWIGHEQYPYVGRADAESPAGQGRRYLEVRARHQHRSAPRTIRKIRSFWTGRTRLVLLVLEEIPGWQHIGDANWKNISIQNVEEMVTRDRKSPSIITWGVRINESGDDHDFLHGRPTPARVCSIRAARPVAFGTSAPVSFWKTFIRTTISQVRPRTRRVQPWLITESVGHTKPDQSWDPESTLIGTMQVASQRAKYGGVEDEYLRGIGLGGVRLQYDVQHRRLVP